MAVLALDYRPHSFKELVGQKHVKAVLKAMVKKNDVPPALLFAGTRGTGKTTSGRILAAALNCEAPVNGDCCAQCVHCVGVQKQNSLAVLEVDAASNGLVDDIRKLKDIVLHTHTAEWRVVLLDEAHSMSKEAFNALLKVLEEPPAQTVFILLTTEAGRIPETVRSRSMTFDFRRLSTPDIVGRLREIANEQNIEAQDELLMDIATRSQGAMRDSVMTLDQCSRVGVSTSSGFRELLGIHSVAVPLFEAALTANYAAGSGIIEEHFMAAGDATDMTKDLTLLVRDLLVLRSGGSLIHLSEASAAERGKLAVRTPVDRLVTVIRTLWDLPARTKHVDDHRAAMEMAFVLIVEALADKSAMPNQHNGNGNGHVAEVPLTMDQLREMAGG